MQTIPVMGIRGFNSRSSLKLVYDICLMFSLAGTGQARQAPASLPNNYFDRFCCYFNKEIKRRRVANPKRSQAIACLPSQCLDRFCYYFKEEMNRKGEVDVTEGISRTLVLF